MQKILLTSDLSTAALSAFPHARRLAIAFKAQVILAAIIEDPARTALEFALQNPVDPTREVHNQVTAHVRSELDKLAEEHLNGVRVQCEVREAAEAVHKEIVKLAGDCAADLIVLSTKGRGGLERMLIGSTAERVLRHATCPVLSVPVKQ